MYQANNPTAILVTQEAANRLSNLRTALHAVADLYAWSSSLATPDLASIGFNSADAQALQSALADANALAQIYLTGLPPQSYPQPAQAYVYAASQRIVIGPQ